MLRACLVIFQILASALVIQAWLVPTRMWEWKLSLGVLELGHWLALPALLSSLIGGLLFRGWPRWATINIGLLLTGCLLVPAYQAAHRDEEFQWGKLWSTGENPAIQPLARKVYWRSHKEQLDALVFRPAKTPPPGTPWILFIHSGGWDNGDADDFLNWNRVLCARGYTIVSMEYHLAPDHKWPAQKDDVRNAVKWVREHGAENGIDPTNLVLMGRSAGGQIATACATTMPDLNAKGCIALYSPMDMEFAHHFSAEDDIVASLKCLRRYLGGDPEDAAEAYQTASAINFITKSSPPTLLIHGTRDVIVWVEQSIRYKAKYEKTGIGDRCTLVELPWAVHGFDYFPHSPGGQVALYQVDQFLKKVDAEARKSASTPAAPAAAQSGGGK